LAEVIALAVPVVVVSILALAAETVPAAQRIAGEQVERGAKDVVNGLVLL
jgi:hypothetical protein